MTNKMGQKISYNEVIRWLEDYFRNQGIEVYRGLEYSGEFKEDIKEAAEGRKVKFHIDPILPIDLVVVKPEVGGHYYDLFWVPLFPDPNLEIRLLFYQFYLSRISELNKVRIFVVIPADCDQGWRKEVERIAEQNRFGLWKVDILQEQPDPIYKPGTFRDRMEEEFKEEFRRPEEEARRLAKFFDRYVRDAIEAMVGITPEQRGKRYIERGILDLVFELENVSYREQLCGLVAKHLSLKGDDYEFVQNAFEELWDECGFETKYSGFLKKFEPILLHIFAGEKMPYRDHYLHQFQVFLLGIYIIDKLYSIDKEIFPPQKERQLLEKQWLVASSFHDVLYPVQLYDEWSQGFFEEILGIEVGASDLKSQFIDKTLLASMGYLITSLCKTHFKKDLYANWLASEKPLIKFFYERITTDKHHCVLGGLSLLKKAIEEVKNTDLLNKVFIPAALAICLHHVEVWGELKEKHGLSEIKLDNDPLAFLLLYCDCVQEWGRPFGVEKARKEKRRKEKARKEKAIFFLKDIKIEGQECLVTVWTPDVSITAPSFKKKENELHALEGFLKSPSGIEFKVCLEDKAGRPRTFSMVGS